MASSNRIVRLLRILAETMEVPPREFAAAALEYASSVLSDARSPAEETGGSELPAVPSVQPYTGPFHLCLDFGTAVSKAFAWNKNSDQPIPLRIGSAAGEPGSPYTISSSIFISQSGTVFLGQRAVTEAAAADPERHQPIQSIKDILTVGQMTDLREPVPSLFNPSKTPITKREAIALYLAYLTDNALLALQADFQEGARYIPRNFTMPVFDQDRDAWATEILSDCANAGQVLADRFSDRWDRGIPLDEVAIGFKEADALRPRLVVDSGVLLEPVAAFASRVRDVARGRRRRRLMMVIDVGAGTTDFAMFARVEHEGEMRLIRIGNSVSAIRIAGDDVDNALIDYLPLQAGITQGHSRLGAIQADLKREIRLIKEELFNRGSVRRTLVNDMTVVATRDEFQECPAMVRLRNLMQERFNEVLTGIHESWLSFTELEVFFTGGGASLDMVTRLAQNQPTTVGNSIITPMPVTQPPPWLQEECGENVVNIYPQLAVCIGGACYGAGKTRLDVDREFEKFEGNLTDVQWEMQGFRDGQ